MVCAIFVCRFRTILSPIKNKAYKMHCFNALLPRWISVGGKCILKQCILWQIFFYWRKYRAKLTNNNSTTPPFSVIYFHGSSLRNKDNSHFTVILLGKTGGVFDRNGKTNMAYYCGQRVHKIACFCSILRCGKRGKSGSRDRGNDSLFMGNEEEGGLLR